MIAPLLSFLAAERGIDLRDYRQDVIEARLAWRIEQTGCASREDYLRQLRADPAEVDRLVDTLLVNVTGFFRESETLELVDRELPQLLRERGAVRAWVVGAATGEEAWSLAMLLHRACGSRPGAEWEILASDIDGDAVRTAAAARYSRAAASSVPRALAGEALLPEGSKSVRLAPALRERVRFARHDLIGPRLAPPEAVVADFDVVLCRNVLIYFTRRLQAKACERLLCAVRPGGLLALGLSESLPEPLQRRVRPLAPHAKVYRLADGADGAP